MAQVDATLRVVDTDNGNTPRDLTVRDLTIPGDVVDTLHDGRKLVAVAGTAVPLATVATPCKWVAITALVDNDGQVNVGGPGVVSLLDSDTGTPLLAGDSTTFPVQDLRAVYVNARYSGDGVTYTWGV